MKTTQTCERDDIVIQWRDLFYAILRHWRSLLVGVLIITLLAGGYGYYRSYRAYQAAVDPDEPAVTLEDPQALANATVAIRYARQYEEAARYLREAPRMQIDASAVPTRTLSYTVSGAHSRAIAALYQNYIGNQAPYDAILAALDGHYEVGDVMELVSVTITPDLQADVVNDEYALLTLQIVAPTETFCQTMADGMIRYMSELRQTVSNAVGQHSCRLSGDVYAVTRSAALRSAQQDAVANCQALHTSLNNARDTLTAEETAYFSQKIQMADEEELEPVRPSVSKKLLLLGFAGGLVLLALVYAVKYLLDHRLKSRADLELRFSAPVFGVLPCPGKEKRGLDRWLYQKLYPGRSALSREETEALIREQIVLLAAEDRSLAIYLTGTALTQEDMELLRQLADAWRQEAGVTVQCISCPLQDAAAMKALENAGSVVLLETVGRSAYDDIYAIEALCERLPHVRLTGIILQG